MTDARRPWSRWMTCLVAVGSVIACVPEYKPPLASEPHAILKVRRVYEQTPGAQLQERVLVNEHLALSSQDHAEVARAPRVDAILVHPVPAAIVVGNSFYHLTMRQVLETYYVQEPYQASETYSCGFGKQSSRTCTRSVTRYRSVSKTRWVTRQEKVVDGACERRWRLAPAVGKTYLLQYTYQDHEACALSCFEQASIGPGQFEQRRCPVAPAIEED